MFAKRKMRAPMLLWLLAQASAPASAQVFMSEAGALKVLFPEAAWTEEEKTLGAEARAALAEATRLRFLEPSYHFKVAREGGHVVGYALTVEEVGKREPISFTVGIDPAGNVTDVIILVYRETRGGEVRDKRFLRQFRGKTPRDPVRVDRDILNFAGATLSAQAIARGVRKALILFERFYASPSKHTSGSARASLPPPRTENARRSSPETSSSNGGSRETPARYRQARYLMGTVCALELYAGEHEQAARAADAAFEALREVDRRMSLFLEDSELCRVNRNAASGPVRVSEELFEILAFAERVSEASEGAFDITVAPLLRAWGFLPARVDLDARRAHLAVGYEKVQLDSTTRTVRFTAPGVEVDLGGIAKGYAVDRAVESLRAQGIRSARLSAGGSTIYFLGTPPDNPLGWDVVLPTGKTLTLRDAALSTSGHSERFLEIAGRRYSHIFDPRRGEPVSSRIASVSVLAPTAMESDALTKPFFIVSEREQEKLRQAFPHVRVWVGGARELAAAKN